MDIIYEGSLEEVLIALKQKISELQIHSHVISSEDALHHYLSSEIMMNNHHETYCLPAGKYISNHDIAMLDAMGIHELEVVRPMGIGLLHYQSKLIHDVRSLIEKEDIYYTFLKLRNAMSKGMITFNQFVVHGKVENLAASAISHMKGCQVFVTKPPMIQHFIAHYQHHHEAALFYHPTEKCLVVAIDPKIETCIATILSSILEYYPVHVSKVEKEATLSSTQRLSGNTVPVHLHTNQDELIATPLHGKLAFKSFLTQKIGLYTHKAEHEEGEQVPILFHSIEK